MINCAVDYRCATHAVLAPHLTLLNEGSGYWYRAFPTPLQGATASPPFLSFPLVAASSATLPYRVGVV